LTDINLFFLQLATGLALGSVYVLLAIGLSLIFGMLTVVNFAHGAFFMVGAYVGVYTLGLTGNFWFSLLLVPIATGALGLIIERVLVRPLYGRSIDDPLLLTFGLSYLLVDVIRALFGISGMPMSTPAWRRFHRRWLLSQIPPVLDCSDRNRGAGPLAVR
jgi:branched-chain amino acid transport system permease protein